MRTFQCAFCSSLIFFENDRCVTCGHPLGFRPDQLEVRALATGSDGERVIGEAPDGPVYRRCHNRRAIGCNWLIPAEEPNELCAACRLTEIIPDRSVAGNLECWSRLESAKRRLLFTLLSLHAPMDAAPDGSVGPLKFHLLGASSDGTSPLTGHQSGIVTINLAEADDAAREERRVQLCEPFRTPLGDFRHEVAHYYWFRLVANSPRIAEFRQRFGDERIDYASALDKHQTSGPAPDWSEQHLSAYASAHPWEDWAETTAHYFHMLDTLETAASFGLTLQSRIRAINTDPGAALERRGDFDALVRSWYSLTIALNAMNRSVGLPDLYPFVISSVGRRKLEFVHSIFTSLSEESVPAQNSMHALNNV